MTSELVIGTLARFYGPTVEVKHDIEQRLVAAELTAHECYHNGWATT
jgi:hypothetical protein